MECLRLITPHGNYYLDISDKNLTIRDFLWSHRVPFNSVSAYLIDKEGKVESFPCLTKTIIEIIESVGEREVVFGADRNIDYQAILKKDILITKSDKKSVAEYSFDTHTGNSISHVMFNEEGCYEFVNTEVCKFVKEFCGNFQNTKIVVGISGGGDSNTLIKSLINAGVNKCNIIPVMMLGIPDWDRGLSRAQAICSEVGLTLNIVTSEEVNQILGRNSSTGNWACDFEKCYPEADLEVIGTLGIRLVLSHVARKNHTDVIVTGLNLEDILSESLYSLLRGEALAKFPVREVDGIKIWYPLYRCPKRMLDGCYPKLSLDNYMDRYPSKIYWRAASYYLAQSMSTIMPGIEFYLIDGLQKASQNCPVNLKFYKELGFSAVPGLSEENISYWLSFLGKKDLHKATSSNIN